MGPCAKAGRYLRYGALALFVAGVLVFPAAAVSAPIFKPAPTERGPAYVPNEVLVTVRPGRSEADLAGLLAEYGGRIKRSLTFCNTYVIELPGAGTPADALIGNKSRVLQRYPALSGVHYNLCRYISDIPNDQFYPTIMDPLYPEFLMGQWQLRAAKHIFAPEGWSLQKGSKNIVVAVLDTGVRDRPRYDDGKLVRIVHPDLEGRVLYGFDAADWLDDDEDNPGPAPTENVRGPSMEHGTHVAGIIAAQANNWIGTAGVCWDNVWILPIKVFKDNRYYATEDELVLGLYYAMNWRQTVSWSEKPLTVNVINLSLGSFYGSELEASMIRQAVMKGIVVCAAAGNWWDMGAFAPDYPGAYDESICVGATDYEDVATLFSNRGRAVDIAAPGWYVISTAWNKGYASVDTEPDTGDGNPPQPSSLSTSAIVWPKPDPMPTWPDKYGNYFLYGAGTSMAAPHVAAAAALLLSHGVPPKDVREILFETAMPKGAGHPNDTYGWGLLNIEGALKKASIDVKIQAPAKGSVVTSARPRFRIDFRHARKDSIRVWIDNIGDADRPVLGGTNPEIPDWEKYLYILDAQAGKTYLLFDYTVDPALAVNGVHRIRVKAESDIAFEVPPPAPLIDDETGEFKVQPQLLWPGWQLFSIPYNFDMPKKPEEVMGTSGTLARWNYTTNPFGEYAMYSFDGSRTDEEATFTPLGALANGLVRPLASTEATPPAGLGYWLRVPSGADMAVPETYGISVDQGPYVIGLYYGWNMVGNPFGFPVAWLNIVVEYAGTRLPVEEAVANGWLSEAIFRYDPAYRQYTWRGVSSAVMVPWEAQWVRVRVRTPELAATTQAAWSDEFSDGVLDEWEPEPHWSAGATGGTATEAGGMLRLLGTSGQAAHVYVANKNYPVYGDFTIDSRLYLADAGPTLAGGVSNAEIRFRASNTGYGYSLSFEAGSSPNTICLCRSDTGEVIQGREVNRDLPSGTTLHVTISCVGTRTKVRVGTLPGRGDVADWELTDSTFTSPGTFWLVNDGMRDCRWDYFRYRPLPLRPPDIKLIVPPNPYTGPVQ